MSRPPERLPTPGPMPDSAPGLPRRRQRWRRLGLFIAAVLALQVAGNFLVAQTWFELLRRHDPMLDLIAVGIAITYTITMALPFVPGIEIGLAVMLAFGQSAILAVYACTQAALLLSFLLGRVVPVALLIRFTEWLRLHAVTALLHRVEPMPPAARLDVLIGETPGRWRRRLIGHRYLALAVLINVPGNVLLGGAGGLGMLAGMSGVITLPRYLLTMAIATTPVPVLLWLGSPQ